VRPLTIGETVFLAVALGLVLTIICAPALPMAVATVFASGGGGSVLLPFLRIAPVAATG